MTTAATELYRVTDKLWWGGLITFCFHFVSTPRTAIMIIRGPRARKKA